MSHSQPDEELPVVDPEFDIDPEGEDDDGPTPPDVIEALGFDPDEEIAEDEEPDDDDRFTTYEGDLEILDEGGVEEKDVTQTVHLFLE